MWIVRIALSRPYTFIVLALLILIATPLVILRTPVDIFPDIDIPVVSIIWNYAGLSPKEMGARVVYPTERSLTTTVNDIEHIESQSLNGVAVIKVFFQPGANIPTAIAQVGAISEAILRNMPPGMTPPLIIKYSASSTPIMQLGLSSKSLSEQELNDVGINQLRPQLVTIPGVAIPYPYGGKSRLISVDIDSAKLSGFGMTPADVINGINAQNLILPSGTQKLGDIEYNVDLNGAVKSVAELNNIPVKSTGSSIVFLHDVAQVRDGFSPQTNVVRQDGQRGVLLSVLKSANVSTLDIVHELDIRLPKVAESLPKDLKITPLFDQSIFVRSAITGVMHEAIIAAALTALMILLFLGDWRATCIIAVSIPLSILTSIIALHFLGETINLMTLGGLALAVGILVDDATVTIENIERHLHDDNLDFHEAILKGAAEIAVPAFVSTLCICIVFVPMFFLSGVARFLFVPMAEAVVFAMMASYFLSRTLVPTLVMYLMEHRSDAAAPRENIFSKIYRSFDAGFEQFRARYAAVLEGILFEHRRTFGVAFVAFCILSCGLYFVLGRDFFPNVDAGQIKLHVRAPSGTRIEETARIADAVERAIREVIPHNEINTMVDNLGLPYSGINLSYSSNGTTGTSDAEILIALNHENHGPTAGYIAQLRHDLPKRFPGLEFAFQPADIVTQILNFGLPSAIDVQFTGRNESENQALAAELAEKIRTVPGAVDVHVQQRFNQPAFSVKIDRNRAQLTGMTTSDVAQNMLMSLSSSSQTSPAFFLNPANSIVYNIAVQTPQYKMDSLDTLMRTPIGSGGRPSQMLGNLVSISPTAQPAVVSHYDITPVVEVYVAVQGRDLGSVASDINKLTTEMQKKLPKGSNLVIRGQVQTMQSSFLGLGIGLVGAIVLVYLLIVVNFQSWLDPLIIITALPAALAGIAWMLFVSGTTLSVPSLTGAIMTMGVATANSILLVSFARQRLDEGVEPLRAALEAGATRLRPVLMTALAMIIGMIPMALGLGEGAEQNAPLGQAVIGGLMFATVSTLFFVPVMFGILHRRFGGHPKIAHATPEVA